MEMNLFDGYTLIIGSAVLLFIGVAIAALINGARMNLLDREMSGGRAKPGDRASMRAKMRVARPVSIDD